MCVSQFPTGRWEMARRHPWSAWKEHYKKNQDRLDVRIREIVDEKMLTSKSRTTYERDRRVNGGVVVDVGDDGEQDRDADQESNELSNDSDAKARPSKRARTTVQSVLNRYVQSRCPVLRALTNIQATTRP